MSENLSQKELLLRLMDKMDKVEREQTEHHSYARSKLESIETQALKTNGRVTKNESDTANNTIEIRNMKTIYATLTVVLGVMWTGVTFFFK